MTHAPVVIRRAIRGDLAEIVRLYADDELPLTRTAEPGTGASLPRDAALSPAHVGAFEAIDADPNNHMFVAELGGEVAGTFQLTFIRQLSYGGCLVAQVESVFVSPAARSKGVGQAMMEFARDEAERRGALRLQLTSNLKRERAHSFYERLGYQATHKGMKLYLESPSRERTTER